MEQVIKFRAWDKKNNRMIQYIPAILFENKEPSISLTTRDSIHNSQDWDILHSDEIVLMQFTGLNDKHGNEIYCGDIVLDEEMGKAIVVFQNGCYFMKYDAESNMGFLGIKEDRFGRLQLERVVEIIGNIHQNSK